MPGETTMGKKGRRARGAKDADVEAEAGTSPYEVGVLGSAATGEASPSQTYGEGVFGVPTRDTIAEGDSVRVGLEGATFGEAQTDVGTARPGSTGGGPVELGSPGSTHDVGVRGSGTVGEGRPRFERWGAPTRRQPGTEPFPDSPTVSEAAYHSGFVFGWNMAERPEHRGKEWPGVEPELRRNWEALHPELPWEVVANAIYDGWAESPATAESSTTAESYRLLE